MLKLTADDFFITDNGIPQALTLEQIRVLIWSRWSWLSSLRLAAREQITLLITNNRMRSSTRWSAAWNIELPSLASTVSRIC